jgi:hypothetical protein
MMGAGFAGWGCLAAFGHTSARKGRWTDIRYASCLIPGFFPKLLFAQTTTTVATLPSALSMSVSSLGASWVFSFQPVLPPDFRPLLPA